MDSKHGSENNGVMSLDAQSPFFILGNARSGTSLFRLMLNNHPEIVVPPECGFSEWLVDDFLGLDINDDLYRKFAEAVCLCRKFETWGIGFDHLLRTLQRLRPQNYRQLCVAVYITYAEKIGKRVELFGDKNNYYIEKTERLEAVFPDSSKIFIIRDGRDVACSYLDLIKKKPKSKYYPDLSRSIASIADEWSANANTALFYENSGSLVIKFEELISYPSDTLTKVCDYLNLSYSKHMLEYYKNNDEPEEFLVWKEKTKEPVQGGNKNNYVTGLACHQVAEFESIAYKMLANFSYI